MTTEANYPIDGSNSCHTPEDCVKLYDTWADSYDIDVIHEEYIGPQLLAEICSKYVQDKNSKILDFLCGTGTDARLMSQLGYTNIDGIDGSEKMLEHSRRIGVYKNLYEEVLKPGIQSDKLPKKHYDALIGVGIFAPGHMQGDYLNHLYEPVKKDGLIIFGIREPWIDELNLKDKLDGLERLGIWHLIERVKKADYRQKVPGVFYIFQRL